MLNFYFFSIFYSFLIFILEYKQDKDGKKL